MGDSGGGGGAAAGQLHRPLPLGVPVGLLCWISGRKKSKTRLSWLLLSKLSMLRRGLIGRELPCLPVTANKF